MLCFSQKWCILYINENVSFLLFSTFSHPGQVQAFEDPKNWAENEFRILENSKKSPNIETGTGTVSLA